MTMAKKSIHTSCQRAIIQLLESIQGKYSKWELWQDFIIMSTVSIANAVNTLHREQREQLYLDRAKKYSESELGVFAQMLKEAIEEMERNPEQDLLGELFMALGLSNEWKGQFFTPYHICQMMAAIMLSTDSNDAFAKKGWCSVNDPACGAGALLIAFANECRRKSINYQTSVLFVAQDIDFLAGCMCYIQLSLMGCAGYVVIDDSIKNPALCYDKNGLIPKDESNVWYTPMYFRDIWELRGLFAQQNLMTKEY